MIAPVLVEAATTREVYLPGSRWYAFDTTQAFDGRRSHSLSVDLATLPIFVREGAIVSASQWCSTPERWRARI